MLRLALRQPHVIVALILATPAQAVPVYLPSFTSTVNRLAFAHGEQAKVRMQSWQLLLVELADKSEVEKVDLVNEFFNRLEFVSDAKQWGVNDFWATPLEMLASNGGDCEDYAISKYTTLRMLGLPPERLRITHVLDWKRNQAHMVLLYYSSAPAGSSDPVVLDNAINETMPLSRRMDLIPVYGFNSLGLWVMPRDGVPRLSGKRLAQWQALSAKLQQQGLQL